MFAGTLAEDIHYRMRWMMLAVYFLLLALYLRKAWGLSLVPGFLASAPAQLLFYPAVTLPDVIAPSALVDGFPRFSSSFGTAAFWQPSLYFLGFTCGALLSLWGLLRLKWNIFEAALGTTTRMAERRVRLQQGRTVSAHGAGLRSVRLPESGLFHGVRALVWKNLVVALRSRRRLLLAGAFTLIYTGFLIALVWLYNHFMAEGGWTSTRDSQDFHQGIGMCLAALAFLLQPVLPFDFRHDGPHLVGFRTLPVSPLALALAEIAVPTCVCLVFQALGIGVLIIYSGFSPLTLMLTLVAFPAVALGLNSVWNLHYLLLAAKRAGAHGHSASAVGALMVVALSFLVFYPAGWTAAKVGQAVSARLSLPLALAAWLAVQYSIDLLLVLLMARLFHRFEVSRDSS
jgi:hypothetical protein